MQLIKKCSSKENHFSIIRKVSNDEKEAMFWVFIKNKGTHAQIKLATSMAEFMKDHEAWVLCDCSEVSKPLMTMALSSKSNYYLKRITLRGKHVASCVFKEVENEYSASQSGRKPCSKKKPLLLHKRGSIEETRSKKSNVSFHSGMASKDSKLARVLYTWLFDARLNRLYLDKTMTLLERYQFLKKAAASYELANKINAADFLFTYPDVDSIARKLKATKHQWSSYARPYALCITVADCIEGKTIQCHYKEKTIDVVLNGELKKSSGRIGANSGPYLVIFTVTDTQDDQGKYQPMNGFYVPVYSKNQLIPVDSGYERRVLQKLEQYARWWQEKGIKTTLIKPLFDIKEFCEGQLCASRPDFIIETATQKYIFEVMGSHEEEYLTRKKRTVKWMEAIGEVIEFDALHADQTKTWDESLKKHLNQLSALILKK